MQKNSFSSKGHYVIKKHRDFFLNEFRAQGSKRVRGHIVFDPTSHRREASLLNLTGVNPRSFFISNCLRSYFKNINKT
jgi:hypothetical protein